jgi:uncharacterized OsmC-like protein
MPDGAGNGGIDIDAVLTRFATPEASRLTVRVGAECDAGLRMDIDMRRHRVTVDEPRSFGGTDEGASPVELLLASLTSCQVITYRIWAARLGIALGRVRVDAEGDLDVRGFLGIDDGVRAGYSAVRLAVVLEGPEPPERYRELADAVDAHCPVFDFAGLAVPIERTLAG